MIGDRYDDTISDELIRGSAQATFHLPFTFHLSPLSSFSPFTILSFSPFPILPFTLDPPKLGALAVAKPQNN